MKREEPRIGQARPLVAVSAAVIQGDSLLLVKRTKGPHKRLWSLPGGLVELGEGLKEAVIREVREECSLSIEPKEVLAVVQDIGPRGDSNEYHFLIICFKAEPRGGEPMAGDDVSDAKWFKIDELDNLPVAPAVREVNRLLRHA